MSLGKPIWESSHTAGGWLHVFQMEQSESNFTPAGASSMQEGRCFLTCKIQLWVSDETMFAHQKISPS